MVIIQMITDSLGLSRDEIPVNDVWTTKVIKQYTKDDNMVLLRGKYGMSMNDIYEEREQILSNNKPDILIVQIGIVDACRRALPPSISRIVKKRPNSFWGKRIRKFARKYHFELTSRFNWHVCSVEEFEAKCRELVSLAKDLNKMCSIAFVKILEPKFELLKRCAWAKEDVNKYNLILEQIVDAEGLSLIDPFKEINSDKFMLMDGHHMNKDGNIKMYQEVAAYVDEKLKFYFSLNS